MKTKDQTGSGANICDEIGALAQQYMMEPGTHGLRRIDAEILHAMRDSRWDDMSKWHRVRLRLIRLQQRQALSEKMNFGCQTRAAG